MECTKCGAELDFREAFCSKCGELTNRSKGASELAGRYASELADGFGKLFATTFGYTTDPDNRKKVALGAAIALVLLVSLTSNPISRGLGSIIEPSPNAPTLNKDGTPNFADYNDVFLTEQSEYFVISTANIRDFPTSKDTNVIGALSEGERVFAREVQAFDPESQWMKLDSGGYVWGYNLVRFE